MAKCNKNETIRYCQCTAPEDFDDDIVIKCNTKSTSRENIYQIGSAGYKEYRFPSLKHCGNRQRPPTDGEIDLPDDEPPPDYKYDPDNKNVTIPNWPTKTGKTRLEVTNYCSNAIKNSQGGRICSKIDFFDFQLYIVQCVSDIRVRFIRTRKTEIIFPQSSRIVFLI